MRRQGLMKHQIFLLREYDFNELIKIITNILPYWQPHFPCNEYLQMHIYFLISVGWTSGSHRTKIDIVASVVERFTYQSKQQCICLFVCISVSAGQPERSGECDWAVVGISWTWHHVWYAVWHQAEGAG